MGSSLECWIEYDGYGQTPFSSGSEFLALTSWEGLSGAKDYEVYAAISGIRNKSGRLPLFALRGLPPQVHWKIEEEVSNFEKTSWLSPRELEEALKYFDVSTENFSLEFQAVLDLLQFFSKRLGNDRVRFVFCLE